MAFEAGRAATAIRPCRSPKSTAAWPTNSASCSLSARKIARGASRRWDALMRSNPSSDRASSVVDIQPPPDRRDGGARASAWLPDWRHLPPHLPRGVALAFAYGVTAPAAGEHHHRELSRHGHRVRRALWAMVAAAT